MTSETPKGQRPASRKKSGGFSLIELMIVLVILGILSTLVAVNVMDAPDKARATAAKTDIKSIESALKLYKLDNGFYPTTEQGLSALVRMPTTKPVPKNFRKGGYLDMDKEPTDPWSNAYVYRSPGTGGRAYDIISLGADGKEGGEDYDADINTRSEE